MKCEVFSEKYFHCIMCFLMYKEVNSLRFLPEKKEDNICHFIIARNVRKLWKFQVDKWISALKQTPDSWLTTLCSIRSSLVNQRWVNNWSPGKETGSQLTILFSCPECKIIKYNGNMKNCPRWKSLPFIVVLKNKDLERDVNKDITNRICCKDFCL